MKKLLKNIRNIAVLTCMVVLLFYCSKIDLPQKPDNSLTVATFNIEWLGDGVTDKKKRTDREYRLIADLIGEMDCDIIAVQEIENEKALAKLLWYLTEYSFYLGDMTGPQKTGFLYKKSIEIKDVYTYQPVAVEVGRTRPGSVIEAKKGNFDFKLMSIHFKATSGWDNTQEKREASYDMRKRQSAMVKNWLDSCIKDGREVDLIVLGDFNDNPIDSKQMTLSPLADYKNGKFISGHLLSCKNPSKWKSIDHIYLSTSASNRLYQNSLFQLDLINTLGENDGAAVSDHCPVMVSFDIAAPDND